jgi:phosphate transport system substrate-binding protein
VRRTLVILAVLGWACARGEPLPAYRPQHRLHAAIRVWGSEEMAALLAGWENGFRQYHPEVLFLDSLHGSETAQAGLYTEVADLALMSRETYLVERYGLWVRNHRYPLEIAVATGSPSDPARTFALAVFVNRANPIRSLTLRQLDGIFGAERSGGWDPVKFTWRRDAARGPEGNLRRWGQAGLADDWSNAPIQPYGYPLTTYASPAKEQGAMYFFRTHVMDGADKWNFAIREFESGAEIVREVGRDRRGIGYTALGLATSEVRAVPIAVDDAHAPVPLTAETVASWRYPLTRSVYICLDRAPGGPLDPKLEEFLQYVLSAQGQAAVAGGSGYLPLTAEAAGNERRKLP